MIKASRRAIFRSVFGRSTFELQLDTANEVLMRVNRSLDPIPVTERMWTAYRGMRRPLRFADLDAELVAGRDIRQQVDALVAGADVGDLPPHVASDLTWLLRVEVLLRMWAEAPGGETAGDERRRAIVVHLEREIVQYASVGEQEEVTARRIAAEIMVLLARVVGRPVLPAPNQT